MSQPGRTSEKSFVPPKLAKTVPIAGWVSRKLAKLAGQLGGPLSREDTDHLNKPPDITADNDSPLEVQDSTFSHTAAPQHGGSTTLRDGMVWAARAMLVAFCSTFALMTTISLLFDDHE